jgi:hypothetical protein
MIAKVERTEQLRDPMTGEKAVQLCLGLVRMKCQYREEFLTHRLRSVLTVPSTSCQAPERNRACLLDSL